jgi:hypothetical protein
MSATGYAFAAFVVAAGVGLLSGWIPKPARLPVGAVVVVLIVLLVIQFAVGQHSLSTDGAAQQTDTSAPAPTDAVPTTVSSAPEAPPPEVTTTTETPTTTEAQQPPVSSDEGLLSLGIQWTSANRHDVDGRVTFQPTGTSEAHEAYAAQLADPDGSYAYPPDCFVSTQVDDTAGAVVKNYPSEPCNGGQIDLGVLDAGNYVLVAKARWTGGSKTAKSPFNVES